MRVWVHAARIGAVVSMASLLLSCGASKGGGEGGQPAASAECEATSMGLDGSFTLPVVSADDGRFKYVLTPLTQDPVPNEYSATRTPVTASTNCPGIAFSASAGQSLGVTGVPRMGQVTSITFTPLPQSDTLFIKTAASAMGMLDGYAGGAMPVANATVTLKNASGASLATGETNQYGSIVLYATSIPDSFRLAVSGGTQSGVAWAGTLKAEVDDYTTVEEDAVINVTPVTTLVAAMHERHPGMSLNEVMVLVKSKLGFPDTLRIKADHQSSIDYFDDAAFFAAAAAAGSVDTLVNAVLDDWQNNVPHSFPPADPQLAMSSRAGLSPQTVSLGDVSNLFSIAGTIYSIYSGVQTAAWQADVINRLTRIEAKVDQMKEQITDLTAITLEAGYTVRRLEINRWENLLINAFTKMVWLSRNPPPPQPANCPAVAPTKVGDDVDGKKWGDLSLDCWKFLGNQIDTREAKAVLRTVTSPPSDMGDGQLLLNGKVGSSGGLLAIYRQQVLLKPEIKKAHKFFTYDDSKRLWDHYDYWKNVQALYAFFYSDWRGFAGDSTGKAKYQADFTTNTAAQLASYMPLRQMLPGQYIDMDNTDFYGNKVGGPLLWWPTTSATSPCALFNVASYSDTNYVFGQFLLGAAFNCYNGGYPSQASTPWRLPLAREWQAFSQVEGYPDQDVGQWLVSRGMKEADGLWFNNKYFFSSVGKSCSTSLPNYTTVSCFLVPYAVPIAQVLAGYNPLGQLVSVIQWAPFIHFNVNHNALTEVNIGIVVPVRETVANEFY
jgi:hypothetical protein